MHYSLTSFLASSLFQFCILFSPLPWAHPESPLLLRCCLLSSGLNWSFGSHLGGFENFPTCPEQPADAKQIIPSHELSYRSQLMKKSGITFGIWFVIEFCWTCVSSMISSALEQTSSVWMTTCIWKHDYEWHWYIENKSQNDPCVCKQASVVIHLLLFFNNNALRNQNTIRHLLVSWFHLS